MTLKSFELLGQNLIREVFFAHAPIYDQIIFISLSVVSITFCVVYLLLKLKLYTKHVVKLTILILTPLLVLFTQKLILLDFTELDHILRASPIKFSFDNLKYVYEANYTLNMCLGNFLRWNTQLFMITLVCLFIFLTLWPRDELVKGVNNNLTILVYLLYVLFLNYFMLLWVLYFCIDVIFIVAVVQMQKQGYFKELKINTTKLYFKCGLSSILIYLLLFYSFWYHDTISLFDPSYRYYTNVEQVIFISIILFAFGIRLGLIPFNFWLIELFSIIPIQQLFFWVLCILPYTAFVFLIFFSGLIDAFNKIYVIYIIVWSIIYTAIIVIQSFFVNKSVNWRFSLVRLLLLNTHFVVFLSCTFYMRVFIFIGGLIGLTLWTNLLLLFLIYIVERYYNTQCLEKLRGAAKDFPILFVISFVLIFFSEFYPYSLKYQHWIVAWAVIAKSTTFMSNDMYFVGLFGLLTHAIALLRILYILCNIKGTRKDYLNVFRELMWGTSRLKLTAHDYLIFLVIISLILVVIGDVEIEWLFYWIGRHDPTASKIILP